MLDHDSWKIYLLAAIHEISEALIHGICLVAPLASWYDVLYNELELELMEWCHISLLRRLGVFEPWLLAQPLC